MNLVNFKDKLIKNLVFRNEDYYFLGNIPTFLDNKNFFNEIEEFRRDNELSFVSFNEGKDFKPKWLQRNLHFLFYKKFYVIIWHEDYKKRYENGLLSFDSIEFRRSLLGFKSRIKSLRTTRMPDKGVLILFKNKKSNDENIQRPYSYEMDRQNRMPHIETVIF